MFLRFILVACVELILIFGLVLSKAIVVDGERVRYETQQISDETFDPITETTVIEMSFTDFVELAVTAGVLAYFLIEGLVALKRVARAWRTSTTPSKLNAG